MVMEYVKGEPYFCLGKKQIKQYPYLKEDLSCEILIIGGGIDGSIANFYLSQNHDVVLVDKDRFGYACTSCATALLEYQLDEYAEDLKSYMSEEEIVLAYNMGLDAITKIENFINKFSNDCDFYLRPTFLYTNSFFSKKDIENEFNFRKNNGFECKLFTNDTNPFPFPIQNGIYCEHGGCEINPYFFTKQMIENSPNQDKIFEHTHITKLEKQPFGYAAISNYGEKINCKKVIIATGFNWEVLNRTDPCERFVSYSIVTQPIKDFSWYNKALIHDESSPYHYLRSLPDGRIIFGGEDTIYRGKPISEKLANKKYKKLTKDLFELFPSLKDNIKIDYQFCGAFGTTNNNLGLIGTSDIDDDILFFISCGANGIINAMAGTEIIEDILNGNSNKLEKIFSPKRNSEK